MFRLPHQRQNFYSIEAGYKQSGMHTEIAGNQLEFLILNLIGICFGFLGLVPDVHSGVKTKAMELAYGIDLCLEYELG